MIATTKPKTRGKWVEFLGRNEWLDARPGMLGSSDLPPLIGLGYSGQNKVSLFADKTCRTPKRFSKSQLKAFRKGQIGERFVLEMFDIERECQSVHSETPSICYHPEIEYAGASLDAYVVIDGEHCVVEAKVVGASQWNHWRPERGDQDDYGGGWHESSEWRDDPPLRHVVQVQHQLDCTGWHRGFLVGLVDGDVKIYEIHRNDSYLELIREKMREFWAGHVVPGVIPELDGTEATSEALRRLWPKDSGEIVELTEKELELFRRIKEIKGTVKSLTSELEEAKNNIKVVMGDASYGLLPSGAAVSWKHQERAAYVVEAGESKPFRLHDRLPKNAARLPVRPIDKSKLPMAI